LRLARAGDLKVVDEALARKVGLELARPPQGLAGTVASCLDLVCRDDVPLDGNELSGLEAAPGLQALEARVAS
jgi:hypothetical protein